MGRKRTDEFRADAVRIALTSGLTRKQVASDLGVGLSTLNKWVTAGSRPMKVGQSALWLRPRR
jgi:transposase